MTDRSDVHRNVRRVIEAGAARDIEVHPRTFPEGTKTAQDAADAIGCEVGQIVKSLIFAVDGEVVLAYVSGANQLDEAKLAAGRVTDLVERDDVERIADGDRQHVVDPRDRDQFVVEGEVLSDFAHDGRVGRAVMQADR